VNVKARLQQVDRRVLSDHEAKRCRALARGEHWQVWEEDLIWWSPDQQRWQPLTENLLPRRRRWLILESEEGYRPAHIWEVGEAFELAPALESRLTSRAERP
jgi:hypothetical protein